MSGIQRYALLIALAFIVHSELATSQTCAESCMPNSQTESCPGVCSREKYPIGELCTGSGIFTAFEAGVCITCLTIPVNIDVEEDDSCPGGSGDRCASGSNSTAPCLPGLTCQSGYCEPAGAPQCASAGASCMNKTCCNGLDCDASDTCEPPNLPPPCGPAGSNCTGVNCVPPSCPEEQGWNPVYCECYQFSTPIVIDTDGSGFHLTSAANGVSFDFFGNGKPVQIAWTATGSTNGWLALDRNGNGNINSGKDLFGNITVQPSSDRPNGFLALAVFDQLENGGNGDGLIDRQDSIWPKLLIWIDSNHDGISQPKELHHLDDIGIHSIGLIHKESTRIDAYGNKFRYQGSLNPDQGKDVDRVIYDVVLANLNQQ
jgi:hypothetical protein